MGVRIDDGETLIAHFISPSCERGIHFVLFTVKACSEEVGAAKTFMDRNTGFFCVPCG